MKSYRRGMQLSWLSLCQGFYLHLEALVHKQLIVKYSKGPCDSISVL